MFTRDWFGVLVALFGVVVILSSCYEWTWLWRGRGIYWPSKIGRKNARILAMITGILLVAIGFSMVFEAMFSLGAFCFFPIGFIFSVILAAILYESRPNQSVAELLSVVTKWRAMPKPKRKHDKKGEE